MSTETITEGEWQLTKGRELATASPARMASIRDELLRRHVRFCAGHSPFYRRRFFESGIAEGDLHGLDDLSLLPCTEKKDLEEHHSDFIATPPPGIVDLCLTSGTTGKPVAMLQTSLDLQRLSYNEELAFCGVGFTRTDRVLVAAAIDRCFMAGLAYFLGLTRIGATVIRGGSSSPAHLTEVVRTCRPSGIVGVPSLLLSLAERLQQEGVLPAQLGVERLVCIGEPVRNQDFSLSPLGERLSEAWGSAIFGTYASTEMATSFTECPAGLGGHLHPDLIAVEIVDEAGRAVASGTPGEVVATPLGVTGMPLIRFRTGDIAVLHEGPCPCGRTTPRLGPILGRKSQMLKCRGTTVYPPAISAALQGVEGVTGHYIEAYSDFALSDRIRVVVGSSDATLARDVVADKIAAAIRVRPEIAIVSPEEIVRTTIREDKRKPVLFFDHRSPGQ